jgi:iron complex transport system substrate-binding protein
MGYLSKSTLWINRFISTTLFGIGVSFLLICIGCNPGPTNPNLEEKIPLLSLTLEDDIGQKIHLENPPQRIISLSPSLSEIMALLGAQKVWVARSQACDYPEEIKSIPEIITYPEMDIEGIIAYEPQLVLATADIFPKDLIARFHQVNIPVWYAQTDSLEDILRQIKALGKITETSERAEIIIDSLQKIQTQVQELGKGQIAYKVLLIVNSNPIMAFGGKSLMQQIFTLAGAKNIAESLSQPFPELTADFILQQDPDFILIPAEEPSQATEFLSHYPALSQLRAVREKRIILVNPSVFLRPGPRAFTALQELQQILHPGLHP